MITGKVNRLEVLSECMSFLRGGQDANLLVTYLGPNTGSFGPKSSDYFVQPTSLLEMKKER